MAHVRAELPAGGSSERRHAHKERKEANSKQSDRSKRLLQKAMKLRERAKESRRGLQLELSVRRGGLP